MNTVGIFPFFQRNEAASTVVRWNASGWQLFRFHPSSSRAPFFGKAVGEQRRAFPSTPEFLGALDPVIVAFPVDAGTVSDVRVAWQRMLPREPISVTEFRTVLTEAHTRAKESLRRKGFLREMMQGQDSAHTRTRQMLRGVFLDGKRVLNPVGFSGGMLNVSATETLLFSRAAHFFAEGERTVPEHRIIPLLLDDAVCACLFPERGTRAKAPLPDACIVLDAGATAVWTFSDSRRGERTSFAIGQESMRRHFMRSFGFTSEAEAQRILAAAAERSVSASLVRRIEKALVSALESWTHAAAQAIRPQATSAMPREVIIVSLEELIPPFSHAFSPKGVRTLFSMFPSVKVRARTVSELFSTSTLPADLMRGGNTVSHALQAFMCFQAIQKNPVAMTQP